MFLFKDFLEVELSDELDGHEDDTQDDGDSDNY